MLRHFSFLCRAIFKSVLAFLFEEISLEEISSDMKEKKGGENNLASKRCLFHKLR
jgi:hypothetical protein